MRFGKGSGTPANPPAAGGGWVSWVEVQRGGNRVAVPTLDHDHLKTYPSSEAAMADLAPLGATVSGAKVLNRTSFPFKEDELAMLEVALKNGHIPD